MGLAVADRQRSSGFERRRWSPAIPFNISSTPAGEKLTAERILDAGLGVVADRVRGSGEFCARNQRIRLVFLRPGAYLVRPSAPNRHCRAPAPPGRFDPA
jgi:hypothetical protein